MRIQIAVVFAALAVGSPARAEPEPPPPPAPPAVDAAAQSVTTIDHPHWLRKVTGADFAALYPRQALVDRVSAMTVIRCRVDGSGYLTACRVIAEAPTDYGFAEAALEISHRFQMEPPMQDGQPIKNGVITMPITWFVPGTAPPMLGENLSFYPAAARSAGIDGEATVNCARNVHLALKGCTLVSESPAGEGFGAAALAMAAKSPDNGALNVTNAAMLAPTSITVQFRLHPPAIDPDLSQMAHVVKQPQVAKVPPPAVMDLYYPARAFRNRLPGIARIHCHVTRAGRLTDCAVDQATPPDEDFGAAAVKVAEREYRMIPMIYDGQPSDAGEAVLTIGFGVK